MKVLITGASGFVGQHLIQHLRQFPDYELNGTSITPLSPALQDLDLVWWSLDLRDPEAVHQMIETLKPNLIFHLAAQAFVPASFDDPWDTLENNIRGQLNLFQSVLKLKLETRILVISSAHVYGRILPEANPISEDHPFKPDTPYSVSKVAQDMLALQYHLSHNLFTVRARPFNHIGPAQNIRFALPNFATQIAAAERGESPPVIQVGNLEAERDFTDVRDVVRAYHLMLTQGQAGMAYNVCQGVSYSMQHLLQHMCSLSHVDLKIEVDKSRVRPLEVPRIVGDSSRLRQATAWQANIDIYQSLKDILDYARQSESD